MNSVERLIDAFLHQVESQPDAIALMGETSAGTSPQTVTWNQLAALVAHCASMISERLAKADSAPARVGYASDNSLVDVVIALSCMAVGAIEVPIDHRINDDEIDRRRNRVGGLWLDENDRQNIDSLITGGLSGSRQRLEVSPDAEDIQSPSLILWTSGTTGTPQGVMLSQRNLTGNAIAKLKAVPQTCDDIRLCLLPICHAYARTCDLGTWLLSGCTLAIALGHVGLQSLAPVIRPTLINSVPSLADRMLRSSMEACGLDRLRLLGCGGAAMTESAFQGWKKRGVTVIQGYGLTETSPVICSATPDNATAGQVGDFVDGWEGEIRDGQLFVRGPHTMLGYWGDDGATAKKIDPHGWLATGDLVERDPQTGQLRILGRMDDVIVLENGRKISPSSIEQMIEQLASVRHAMIVNRRGIQVWIDAHEASPQRVLSQEISELLSKHSEAHTWTLHRFDSPLDAAAGELTSKGTIRRAQIAKNRFSS